MLCITACESSHWAPHYPTCPTSASGWAATAMPCTTSTSPSGQCLWQCTPWRWAAWTTLTCSRGHWTTACTKWLPATVIANRWVLSCRCHYWTISSIHLHHITVTYTAGAHLLLQQEQHRALEYHAGQEVPRAVPLSGNLTTSLTVPTPTACIRWSVAVIKFKWPLDM